MSVEIVDYEPTHESGVVSLWRNAFAYAEARNEPSSVIRSKIANADGLFLVALQEKHVVGTAMGGYDGHRAWLYAVAVDPGLRLRSVGRRLVVELESRLVLLGACKINLQVRSDDPGVVAFYESLGYTVEPRTSMGKAVDR